MQEKFHQYNLTMELATKYSHSTYLASPINAQKEHSEPEHQVVLAVFASSLFRFPHEREELLSKAKRIKQLQHPHLMPILDIGIEQERPFVVRGYLPNGSLRDRLKSVSPHRLELKDALTIILQVGQALAYAHEHNIFHGNIKPENILFNTNGQAVVTDFNLISRNDAVIRDQTAQEYAFCYMPPEQFAGTCDPRSDQYALGCLAYEMITGHVPFAAQSLASMMGHHSNMQPAPLSEIVADLSPSLEAAVLKTLAADPEERFFDFSLFLDVIQSVLLPSPAFPLSRPPHSRTNKTISYSAQSAKAESILSSIRNRATKRAASPPAVSALSPTHENVSSQPLEPSETLSDSKVDTSALAATPLTAQTSMLKWTGIIPPPESLKTALHFHQFTFPFSQSEDPLNHKVQPPQEQKEHNESSAPVLESKQQSEVPTSESAMMTLMPKQKIDDNPFVEEEACAPIPESSIFGQDEDATATEVIPSLVSSIDMSKTQGERTLPTSRNREREFRLALVISVIITVIISALWSSGMLKPSTSLHTAQNMPHVAVISTKSTPMIQFSAEASVVPVPAVEPAMHATSMPTAQPPIFIPAPTPPMPAAIATPSTSYEAEAPGNTRDGTKTFSCNLCSGGIRVGWISDNVFLQFNHVNVNYDGNYTLTIYYLNSISDRQTSASVSVNGGPNIMVPGIQVLHGNCCDNVPPQVTQMTISLHAGSNTIKLSNPTGYAPDIDRIVVG